MSFRHSSLRHLDVSRGSSAAQLVTPSWGEPFTRKWGVPGMERVLHASLVMAMTGGAHVAARFMLSSEKFNGVLGVDELRYVLAGYDDGAEWPRGSGLSFTQGLAPRAWEEGFRMAALAEPLQQAMVDALPERYEGPIEFPMRSVAMSARHALLQIAGGADPSDLMAVSTLRSIVEGTGHTMLMAVVTAITPRLRKRSGPQ